MTSTRPGLWLVPLLTFATGLGAAAAPRIATPLTVTDAHVAGAVTTLALDLQAYGRLRPVAGVFTLTGFHLDAATQVDLVLERFEVLTADARIVVGTADGDVEGVRSFHDRTVCGRPVAERNGTAAAGDRFSPQPHDQRRGRSRR